MTEPTSSPSTSNGATERSSRASRPCTWPDWHDPHRVLNCSRQRHRVRVQALFVAPPARGGSEELLLPGDRGSQPPGAPWHAGTMTIHVAEDPRDGRGVRDALVATFRRVMRLYFRDIERLGNPPGPEVRGRVFVANHTNALIDPILVITDAACEISPIAKSTLWSVPGLRWLLDRAGAVPIVRRVDTPDKAA